VDKKTKAIFSEIMREIGRKGGKIGGKRSLETMTPAERSARAKKASLAAAKKRTADRLARAGGKPTTGKAAKKK
jgi:general stress protein YciG